MQTDIFEVDPLSDNRKLYVRAAEALAAGALVGIPTETVYGLGADALNPDAVAKILKSRDALLSTRSSFMCIMGKKSRNTRTFQKNFGNWCTPWHPNSGRGL